MMPSKKGVHRVGRLTVGGAVAALFALSGCTELITDPDIPEGYTRLQLQADLAGTPAAALVVEVSGSNIPTNLVFEIKNTGGVASEALALPVGLDRAIAIRAFDANGVESHTGSTTLDILASDNATAQWALDPHGDGKTIDVRLGVFVVTLTPDVSEIEVGEKIQLTATIVDVQGKSIDHHVQLGSHAERGHVMSRLLVSRDTLQISGNVPSGPFSSRFVPSCTDLADPSSHSVPSNPVLSFHVGLQMVCIASVPQLLAPARAALTFLRIDGLSRRCDA